MLSKPPRRERKRRDATITIKMMMIAVSVPTIIMMLFIAPSSSETATKPVALSAVMAFSSRVTTTTPAARISTFRMKTKTALKSTTNDNGKNAWLDQFGSSALKNVQTLAAGVTNADRKSSFKIAPQGGGGGGSNIASSSIDGRGRGGTGGTGTLYREEIIGRSYGSLDDEKVIKRRGDDDKVVLGALANLERDMQMLDDLAGSKPQLSPLEITLLTLSIIAASSGPIISPTEGYRISEVLAPAAAAFSASIGIGAEFIGKVAVADGKEVAAAAIQCAAEAEGLLANAERVKAVTPLCVGVGATSASFALLVPVLIEALGIGSNAQLCTELYLLCPLVGILSAAVSSLALEETISYCSRAISVGNRRFAKSGLVSRTWLSASEQIQKNSNRSSLRWRSFAISVLPAPILGALVPGTLPTKTIVVSALAAAQSAYFLAQAERTLARATDAVALKARSAAVCDTYANQGARSAAILPFTSALSAFCAAATAAIVELPWLESLAAMGGGGSVVAQALLVSIFPTLSSLFAAAASVSKARCEVDAEAAVQAASTLALEYETIEGKNANTGLLGWLGGDGRDEKDPVLRPWRGVAELIRLTAQSGWKTFVPRVRNVMRPLLFGIRRMAITRWLLRKRNKDNDEDAGNNSAEGPPQTDAVPGIA